MTVPKKRTPAPTAPPRHGTIPAPLGEVTHHDITSPDVVHKNDRMKLAEQPNEGQPLSHRNRGKAGRKG